MRNFIPSLILSLLYLFVAESQAQNNYYLNSSGVFLNSEEKAQYRLSVKTENESTFLLYFSEKNKSSWSEPVFLQRAQQLNDSVLWVAYNKQMKNSFKREIVGQDEMGYLVREYDSEGILLLECQTITVFPLQYNGKTTLFDQEGRSMAEEVYIRGKRIREQLLFQPVDSTTIITSEPEFPGGREEFLKMVARGVKYPVSFLNNREGGKTYVRFIINENGDIENMSSARSGYNKLLTRELIRSVSSINIKWIPAKCNGKIIPVWYYATVKFNAPVVLSN